MKGVLDAKRGLGLQKDCTLVIPANTLLEPACMIIWCCEVLMGFSSLVLPPPTVKRSLNTVPFRAR